MSPLLQAPSVPFMILAFLLMLGPLVTLHELGHYLVGRWCGVQADAFSVGFGRELLGWTDRRGTRWKLSALPLGGYVQFAGDANAASMPASEEAPTGPWASMAGPAEDRSHWLQNRPLWQRALVVAAGPFANFLIAVVIFAAFNLAYGHIVAPPVIAGFSQPSPAQAAGLRAGDRITAIDGAAIDSFEDVQAKIMPVPGETLSISVQRGTARLTLPVHVGTRLLTDRFGNSDKVGLLGVAGTGGQIVKVGPVDAVRLAVSQCGSMMGTMVTGIRQIVMGTRSVSELGGPVKIARYSGEQLALGWQQFVYFAGAISINLAFINLLPIPALDGGHLLFYAAEAVRRKPLGKHSQEWAFRTGMAFVLALMLFVTINDIASLHPLSHVFGG